MTEANQGEGMRTHYRTHTCGELSLENEGEPVVLAGWVANRRDMGPFVFLVLRDRYGTTQVVVEEPALVEAARSIPEESVIQVEGTVRRRPEKEIRPGPTGAIEVVARNLRLLNRTRPLPFAIRDDVEAFEETRLRWRFLDLRRPVMQRYLATRHRFIKAVRDFLDREGFLEIETPILTRSTPEGARDFLVPSRLHRGKFYALPQSPQLYKQILMVSGFDRYFQIARCFRDEDLRADRQPEFTQIDLEMSFVDMEDVLSLTERMMHHAFRAVGAELEIPLPRLTFEESMRRFGTDKPDLRISYPELVDLSPVLGGRGFRVVDGVLAEGGRAIGVFLPETFSRKEVDAFTRMARDFGAGGLLWARAEEGEWKTGPLAKWLDERVWDALGDVPRTGTLFVVADFSWLPHRILGEIRRRVALERGRLKEGFFGLWVTHFPILEWNEEEKRLEPAHHMFTQIVEEDLERFYGLREWLEPRMEALRAGDRKVLQEVETHLLRIRGKQYDLVINGWEVGSGSIRIHERRLQEAVMDLIGLSPEERERRFGFLLRVFEYGAPPHGGIAPGVDRIVALLVGAESIRDVIAFPKTTSAQALFEGAPSEVDPRQLQELGLRVEQEVEE